MLARCCVLILAFAASTASAQLSIEITGAGAQRVPVAIVPFAGEGAVPPGLSGVIRTDLERSGLFRGLEVPPMSPPRSFVLKYNPLDPL